MARQTAYIYGHNSTKEFLSYVGEHTRHRTELGFHRAAVDNPETRALLNIRCADCGIILFDLMIPNINEQGEI